MEEFLEARVREQNSMSFYFYFAVRYFAAPLLLSAVAVAVLLSVPFRSFRISLFTAFVIAAVWSASFARVPRAPISEPQAPAEHTVAGFTV